MNTETLKQIEDGLEELYLDWVNNWISTPAMAEHYEIHTTVLVAYLKAGKRVHDKRTENVNTN